MSISISSLLKTAIATSVRNSAEEEATKVGILRAGNSGAMALGGKSLGKCPRQTFLRFKGVSVNEAEESRQHMFAAGHTNEDIWYDLLSLAYPKEQILREEEVPIQWELDGYKVTGRPDLVLTDAEKKPILGLELKLVSSLWTARDVMFSSHPKTDHLVQAAHYSWKLGVPFELWYASRVDWAINAQNPKKNSKYDWIARMFPKPGEPNSEHLEYNYWRPDTNNQFGWSKTDSSDTGSGVIGIPKKINPFLVGYRLEWNSAGQLTYQRISENGVEYEPVHTVITQKGIEDYYRTVIHAERTGVLPPRISQIDATGEAASYSLCNYCELKSVCDSGISTTAELIQGAKELVASTQVSEG
jgi:hypothetical protein